MATRRSTLSIAAITILAAACGDPPADPTGVAPSFHRDGTGHRAVVVDPAGRHDATTIQAGIDLAPAGGRVVVNPGTYNEALVINKALTLEAARGDDDHDEGRNGPVIVERTAPGTGPVINVLTSQAVRLRGFTVRHVNVVGITARPIGGANLTVERMTIAGDWTLPPPISGSGLAMSHNTAQSGGRSRLVVRDSRLSGVSAPMRLFGDVDVVIERNAFDVRTSCLVVSPTGTGGGVVPAGAVTNVDIINNDFDHCGSDGPGLDGNGIRIEGTVGATTTGSVNIIGNRFRNTIRTPGECNATAILYEFYSGRIEHNSFRNVVQDCAGPTLRSLPGAIFVGSVTAGMSAANPVVRFNDFVGNADAGLRVAPNITTSLDARCNYWGSASGPSGVGPGTGDAIVVEAGAARPISTPFATGPVARHRHDGDHGDDDGDDGDGGGSCRLDYSLWSTPVNLGPPINTALGEFGGALSPDGLALYFNSNRLGGFGLTDLWVSRRACRECPWGPAQNLGPTLNGPTAEGGVEFSTDGHLLFFHSDRPGGFGLRDIYVSRRDETDDDLGWGPPVNLGPYVNTSSDEQSPSYSGGERAGSATLYFHRGLGGPIPDNTTDIYAVEFSHAGDPRAAAVAVAELNDPTLQDASPAVRDDGREIIFASSRAGGVGGPSGMALDLWFSTRRSIRDAWSRPEYLGAPLNTTGTEGDATLSRDGLVLLFFSGRAVSVGMNDIWMSTRTQIDR